MTHASEIPLSLRFRRYECKYLISEDQAARIRAYAKPYTALDPFAARSPLGRYEISSLYLDSASMRLYRETLGGVKERFKLRIRAYSDRYEDPVFFEVKSRSDRVILKDRSRVRRAEIKPAINGWIGNRDRMDHDELQSLEAFQARVRSIDAHPQILVRYDREAYVGTFDSSVRLTFDRNLRTQPPNSRDLFFSGHGWQNVEGGKVLLELKFNNQCPPWIAAIVRQEALRRISFSKYALSVSVAAKLGAIQV